MSICNVRQEYHNCSHSYKIQTSYKTELIFSVNGDGLVNFILYIKNLFVLQYDTGAVPSSKVGCIDFIHIELQKFYLTEH